MAPTVRRGSSEPIGSWNTICTPGAQRAQLALAPPDDGAALEADVARRRRVEADEEPGQRGLARAGLADDADALARPRRRATRPAGRGARAPAPAASGGAGGSRGTTSIASRIGPLMPAPSIGMPARHPALVTAEGRHRLAHLGGPRAAGAEHAARREVAGRRHGAGDGGQPAPLVEPGRIGGGRRRVQQPGRVRVPGRREHGRRRARSPRCAPPYITSTRSHRPDTTARSWVMNSRALPSSATSRSMRASMRACTVTSSAVVGSSQISTAGSQASAMASMTRWRWPPESWCG